MTSQVDAQIPLDLSPDPNFTFETFEVGEFNKAAFALVTSWPNWPAPVVAIIGPPGVGKSHLGRAWTEQHAGQMMTGSDCDLIYDFEAQTRLFLDDANQASETELFTLLNLALNGQIEALILASRRSPKDWNTSLPDLRSRLKNIPVVELNEHDDAVLGRIIRKLFEDCGRAVTRDVVTYLLAHDDRSVASLRRRVREIDFAARQAKKDVTRPFVAEHLKADVSKME